MSVYNGVAGVAQMFGYPLPKVPKKLREGAQSSVDSLKQESSVEAFGAIHEKAKDKDEKKESVRGASLRELKKFFEAQPEPENYAGLRRIGDPNDGTAVWTRLTDPVEVKDALEKRAKERSAETEQSEKLFSELLDKSENPTGKADEPTRGQVDEEATAPAPASAVPKKEGDPEETQTVSQEQIKELEERLNKLETANASCKCAIA